MTKPPNRTKESLRQTMRQLMRAMDFASLIASGRFTAPADRGRITSSP